MTAHISRFFLNLLLVVTTCFVGMASAWAGEVIIGTGAAAMENIFRKIEYPMSRAQGIKMNIIDRGPVPAWKDLDAGKIQCAVGGMGFDDWLELMKKSGYNIPDPSVYRSWVIGQDRIKVLTNLDVPVTSLSKEQMQGIFSGAIKNWSQVGGPDKPILVVMGSRIQGTVAMFQKNVMGTSPYTKDAMMGTTAEDVKSRVVRNSGAVGFTPASQVDYLVNNPKHPEIVRPITLITKGAPTEDIERMINYINTSGQRYVVK